MKTHSNTRISLYKGLTAVLLLAIAPLTIASSDESTAQRQTLTLQYGVTRTIEGTVTAVEEAALAAAGLTVSAAQANTAVSGRPLLSEGFAWPDNPRQNPSPSHISQRVFKATRFQYNEESVSTMAVAWGQFAGHDMVETVTSATKWQFPQTEVCTQVSQPPGEAPVLNCVPDARTLSIHRLEHSNTSSDDQALNLQSSYIDASGVYAGSNPRANALRSFQAGKLISDPATGLPSNNPVIFDVAGPVADNLQLLGGDPRAAENPGLLVLGGVWVLEHNRRCDELKAAHPTWSDEELYNAARRFVTALVQRVTYYEYLPAILGEPLPAYTGYDNTASGRIDVGLAVAAFRYGHSSINRIYLRERANGEILPPVILAESYFAPYTYIDSTTELEADDGLGPRTGRAIAPLLRGLVKQDQAHIDVQVIKDVHEQLFEAPFDLVAINIARGREVGLPTYLEARQHLGLSVVTTWEEVCANGDDSALLSDAYGGDLSLLDYWVGGICEPHLPGAVVGELFAAAFRRTMGRVRSADPWWYEREGILTSAELVEVNSTTLADVINRNTRANVFGDIFKQSCPCGGGNC